MRLASIPVATSLVAPLILAAILLAPTPSRAGDNPDIPYLSMKKWIPQLLEHRTELATLRSHICSGVEPASPEAFAASEVLVLLKKLRLDTKELAGEPEYFLRFEKDLPSFPEVGGDPPLREMIAAIPDVHRLQPQLDGLGKLVKKARSAVQKSSDPESAQRACEALALLQKRLDAVEPGAFAPVEPRGASGSSALGAPAAIGDAHLGLLPVGALWTLSLLALVAWL